VHFEEVEKRIDILKVRGSHQNEKIETLEGTMNLLDNHMRHALKDVSTMQFDLGTFKTKVDSEVHNFTEAVNQKLAQ
jgi:uncharacterized coiled-coil protein SlyX